MAYSIPQFDKAVNSKKSSPLSKNGLLSVFIRVLATIAVSVRRAFQRRAVVSGRRTVQAAAAASGITDGTEP